MDIFVNVYIVNLKQEHVTPLSVQIKPVCMY